MASTSTHYEYDVFLCFRGEDTRNSFSDHLYMALRQAGIRTFRDDDSIHEGQQLKPKIERSITKSRASIIIFSQNFANSRWCLEELWLILRQKRYCNHFVIPMFYGVDPSDVRNHRGSFNIKEKQGAENWSQENVIRWKAALTEVADLKGMVVSGYETVFIRNIVFKIYCELGLKVHSTRAGLTGIETRAEDINSWLRYEQQPVLAICGMGGSGKTTLAKHIYYSNKENFDSSSLVDNIEKQQDGLLGIQKQLLREISGNDNIIISNVFEGALQLEKAIHMNRVLIVVDDINDKDTLSTLFGTKVLFHTQSKIIITTRLLNIDTWSECISWRCHVHNIKLLNCHESLELLCCHAFGSKIPMEGFKELAVKLAHYCEGNPLALKVLGSSLCAQDQWTRNDMMDVWRSRINSLKSLEGDLDRKIQDVLQKSYESLPCDSHKELFLHIACLFVGEYASHVETILEKDYHAKFGMVTLINRCLLTLSRNGLRLVMHNILQDMARKIVRNESKDPAKHSRVWRHDESYRLLRKGYGSETIEGLALNMLKFKEVKKFEALKTLKTSSLINMRNLKFLHLRGVTLTGSYENFPELRWLRWQGCNLKIIPRGLWMSSLVALDMSCGDLEKFELPMVLNSLKILDLSSSYKLVSIRNLYRLPKLVDLVLFDCTSLTHVCKTIDELENLSFLNFARCPNLLKALFIPEQIPLFSLPQSLYGWSLASNPIEILPNYVDLKMIQYLNLNGCANLKSLPCLPSTLKELNVDWCTSLERVTFQSARFTLEKFDYEGCFQLCEIQGLFKLVSIAKLDEADLQHMQWIKVYKDHKVDLVGDVITQGRTFNIQMLSEYGIRSIYLQGIKDESMTRHEYMSSSRFLSFLVPWHPKENRIQGLNVTLLYRSSGEEDRDMLPPLAKVSNRTNGVSWVYNPVVFCQPIVDEEDVMWLSNWPIGDILDVGDEVHLNIFLDKKVLIVRECGASLVFMNYDGKVEKREQVIGGDLSEFEVTKGGYYLCRNDFFQSRTPDVLKILFGDTSLYTDSRRWRPSSQPVSAVYPEVNAFRNPNRYKIEVELGVNFSSESETD